MCLTSFYLQQRIRKDLKGKKDFHFELRSNRNWVYFLPWNNQNDRQTDRQNIWNSGFQTISGNERQLLRERKTRTLPFPKLSATQGFPGCNTEEKTQAELSQFSEWRILCLRTELEIWGDQGGQNLQERVPKRREATHWIWSSAEGLPQVCSITDPRVWGN